MKKLVCMLGMLFFFAVFLSADFVVKTRTQIKSSGIRGTGESIDEGVTETWIGDGRMVTRRADSTFIVDLSKNTMAVMNQKSKVYSEFNLPLDLEKVKVKDKTSKQMMKQMKIFVSINSTKEKREIGKWECTKYEVVMKLPIADINMIYWVTTDVPFDWKQYNHMYAQVAKMAFIKNGAEFKKLGGFPIYTEFSMKGEGISMSGTTMVEDISQKEASLSTQYAVPEGYRNIDGWDRSVMVTCECE